MDTERAKEILPWLLNGSLEEPERGELLAALRGDPELRRELAETRAAGEIFAQHVSAEDLVAHAFGAPTGLAGERIEAHLALCERCADELALVRESRSLESEPDTPWVTTACSARSSRVGWTPSVCTRTTTRWPSATSSPRHRRTCSSCRASTCRTGTT